MSDDRQTQDEEQAPPNEEPRTLDAKVDALQKKFDRLADELKTLTWTISRMKDSKLTDPRHSLYDWELQHLRSETHQAQFRAALKALQNRIEGVPIPDNEKINVDGVSGEKLYATTPPTIDEVLDTLKTIVPMSDDGVLDLMRAVEQQRDLDLHYLELSDLVSFVQDSVKPR